jgi:hypothetical protein
VPGRPADASLGGENQIGWGEATWRAGCR